MKTSNIILVVFFLTVFITPVLVAVALNSKIKSGKYSRIINSREENRRKLETGKFQVLEINKGVGEFHCTIINDGDSFIEYDWHRNDTIALTHIGDTLSIKNMLLKPENNWDRDYFHVTIHTNNLSFLKVNGASVLIKWIPEAARLKILLTDTAALTFIEPLQPDEDDFVNQRRKEMQNMSTTSDALLKFDQLDIVAHASGVYLADNVSVNTLTINADGQSTLHFFSKFSYKTIAGHIDENTAVKGSWKVLRNLESVNK